MPFKIALKERIDHESLVLAWVQCFTLLVSTGATYYSLLTTLNFMPPLSIVAANKRIVCTSIPVLSFTKPLSLT